MKARQNQQQGQCKGRGRQQTEKISTGRQGQKGRQQTVRVNRQSRCQGIRKQGKRSECQPGQNKTSQWVSVCVLLLCECVNEVQVWWDNQGWLVIGDSCVIGVMECVGAVHDGRCSPWVMCSCSEWQPDSWQVRLSLGRFAFPLQFSTAILR